MLHGTVSPGLLAHVEFRVSPSLDRDPQGSAVGAAFLGVRCVVHYGWSERYKVSAATSGLSCCLGLTSSLESQDLGRGEWLVREREGHAISCRAHLSSFLLSELMTFVPAAPKGSHFGEMSQASAWMILLHPSFLSLPPPLYPSSAFFVLKGHCLEIQVQGKVITFSLQVCLSKNLHIISGWNTGIIPEGNVISRSWACLPLGFTSHLSPMLRAMVTVWLILQPCSLLCHLGRAEIKCLIQSHTSNKWWVHLDFQPELSDSRTTHATTLPCNCSDFVYRIQNWDTLSD